MTEIVVGLDLSPSARAALDWAAEQARATGRTLRAVHVINASATYSMALGGMAVPLEPSEMDAPTAMRSRPYSTPRNQSWDGN